MRTALTVALALVASTSISTSIALAQAPGQTPPAADLDEPQAPAGYVPQAPAGYVPLAPATFELGATQTAAPVTVSYRSQVITADALSIGAILVGAAHGGEAGGQLAMLGLTGYMLGAPIVHVAKGRGTAAVKSLAVRGIAPILGAAAGYRLGPQDVTCATSHGGGGGGCSENGSIIGMLGGFLVGGAAAMVIDAKYLATYQRPASGPTWTANVVPTRGGASFGVSGTF